LNISWQCLCIKDADVFRAESSVDAAALDVAMAMKSTLKLNPNSTDEEKLLRTSALAYSFCSDFDLSGRCVREHD